MNRKITKESLEEKMARVALKKQKILEEKKSTARKYMTPRVRKSEMLDNIANQDDVQLNTARVNNFIADKKSYEAENGWEKRQNGRSKIFRSSPIRNMPSKSKKLTKQMIDQKMARVAMRKQSILESKKQKAREFMKMRKNSSKKSLEIIDDISNQVDKVLVKELPKPVKCVQEHTLTKLLEVQKLLHETTQMMLMLKKQENELIDQLSN